MLPFSTKSKTYGKIVLSLTSAFFLSRILVTVVLYPDVPLVRQTFKILVNKKREEFISALVRLPETFHSLSQKLAYKQTIPSPFLPPQVEIFPTKKEFPTLYISPTSQQIPPVTNTAATIIPTKVWIPPSPTLKFSSPVPTQPTADGTNSEALIYHNSLRRCAGVPELIEDPLLSREGQLHALYMSLNQVLTHGEDPKKPGYTPEGDRSGRNSVLAGGGSNLVSLFDQWIKSVPHRVQLLDPKLKRTGYGFYQGWGGVNTLQGRVSRNWSGWPVVFPCPNQNGVPRFAYTPTGNNCFDGNTHKKTTPPPYNYFPITLQFDLYFFNPNPKLTKGKINNSNGSSFPFVYCLSQDVITLYPTSLYSKSTQYKVAVEGTYSGGNFQKTWSFTTDRE